MNQGTELFSVYFFFLNCYLFLLAYLARGFATATLLVPHHGAWSWAKNWKWDWGWISSSQERLCEMAARERPPYTLQLEPLSSWPQHRYWWLWDVAVDRKSVARNHQLAWRVRKCEKARRKPEVLTSTKRNRQRVAGFSPCWTLICSLPGYILLQLLKEWVRCKLPDNLLSWNSVDVSLSLLDPVFGPASIPCWIKVLVPVNMTWVTKAGGNCRQIGMAKQFKRGALCCPSG